MNTYLKYQPAAIQFFAFLSLAGAMFILNSLISNYLFADVTQAVVDKNVAVAADTIARFKWAQLLSAAISFLAPALIFGYFSSPDALPYIGLRRPVYPIIVVAGVVLLFVIQPLIGYLGYLNNHIDFGSLKKYVQTMEASYDRAMKLFLQMHNIGDLLFNMLIMALLPAVSEELFFRGAFQKSLYRLSKSAWFSVLVSAAIFALLHGTLLKVIPIFALGILLGTVYQLTQNIWYNIVIHFLNNGLALLAYYYADKSPWLKRLADDDTAMPLYGAFISLAATIALVYFMGKKAKELSGNHVEVNLENAA